MFEFFERKKNDTSTVTVDLLVDALIYEQLKKRAHTDGILEDDALLYSLKRGMSDYWLHVAQAYKEDYKLLTNLFQQSKLDNEILRAIMSQNERFYEILEDKEKQRETRGEKQ